MNVCNVCFSFLSFSIEFGIHDAWAHCRDGHLFGGANGIQVCIGEFHLSGVYVIDQFILVCKIDADDIVIELCDDVVQVCKFSPFDLYVHLVDPNGVHCVPGSRDTALNIRNLPRFLWSKSSVEWSAVLSGDGSPGVK